MILRHHVKRRESTCPRYVVTVAARRENRKDGRGWRAALVCGQKLLFPYKAPLSRTILLEWLRKMPNRRTLGIAVSSAAVSSDRGKNSTATLGLDRFRPAALAATVRLCGEIVVALSPTMSVSVFSLHRHRPLGRESTFLQGCQSIWRMYRERRASVGAERKKARFQRKKG